MQEKRIDEEKKTKFEWITNELIWIHWWERKIQTLLECFPQPLKSVSEATKNISTVKIHL